MPLDVQRVTRAMRRMVLTLAPIEEQDELVERAVRAAERWFDRRNVQPTKLDARGILRGVVATWRRKRERASAPVTSRRVVSKKQIARGIKTTGAKLLAVAKLVAKDILGERVRKSMRAELVDLDGRKRLSAKDRERIANAVDHYVFGDPEAPNAVGVNSGAVPRADRYSSATDRPRRVQLLTSPEYLSWSNRELAALFVLVGLVAAPRGKCMTGRALIHREMQAIRRWRDARPKAYRCSSRTARAQKPA